MKAEKRERLKMLCAEAVPEPLRVASYSSHDHGWLIVDPDGQTVLISRTDFKLNDRRALADFVAQSSVAMPELIADNAKLREQLELADEMADSVECLLGVTMLDEDESGQQEARAAYRKARKEAGQ